MYNDDDDDAELMVLRQVILGADVAADGGVMLGSIVWLIFALRRQRWFVITFIEMAGGGFVGWLVALSSFMRK